MKSFKFYLQVGDHELVIQSGLCSYHELRDGVRILHYAEFVSADEVGIATDVAARLGGVDTLTDSEKRRMLIALGAVLKTAQRHLAKHEGSKA